MNSRQLVAEGSSTLTTCGTKHLKLNLLCEHDVNSIYAVVHGKGILKVLLPENRN